MINNNNSLYNKENNLEYTDSYNFDCIENCPRNDFNFLYYQSSSNNENKISTLNQQNISYYDQEKMETPKMSLNIEQNEKPSFHNYKKIDEITKNPTFKVTTISSSTNEQTLNNNIIPKINNIVSSAHLSCNINLKQIALQVHKTNYNPAKYSGLFMRIKEPKTTAVIFSNGKMICLGAKSEEDSYKACKIYAKIIKKCNYPVVLKEFKIRNIFGTCNVNFKIPLLKLYILIKKELKNSKFAFEPDNFPGLIYHYLEDKNMHEEKSNIVFLIFASGKVVITGAKKKIQMYDAFKNMFLLLNKVINNNT